MFLSHHLLSKVSKNLHLFVVDQVKSCGSKYIPTGFLGFWKFEAWYCLLKFKEPFDFIQFYILKS